MDTLGFVIMAALLAVIIILVLTIIFEKEVINQIFEENREVKEQLFELVKEEEKWCSDIFESHRLVFDERCLYDVVKRVEIIEKELLKGRSCKCDKKTIDVYNPKEDKK